MAKVKRGLKRSATTDIATIDQMTKLVAKQKKLMREIKSIKGDIARIQCAEKIDMMRDLRLRTLNKQAAEKQQELDNITDEIARHQRPAKPAIKAQQQRLIRWRETRAKGYRGRLWVRRSHWVKVYPPFEIEGKPNSPSPFP